ncbi:hypothetical protein B0H19DRAFT_1254085 [Mycena capillaripes]|nr:hypothetical protein B0H19DRAFT_1254085 [Mycena capillaripes]
MLFLFDRNVHAHFHGCLRDSIVLGVASSCFALAPQLMLHHLHADDAPLLRIHADSPTLRPGVAKSPRRDTHQLRPSTSDGSPHVEN